jgi:Tol biopolymer transport system component
LLVFISSCGATTDDTSGPPTATPLGADQLVFDSDRTGNHEIFMMKTDGSGTKQLTNDAQYENWWPKISPDCKKVLFYRAPRGKSESYADGRLTIGVGGNNEYPSN